MCTEFITLQDGIYNIQIPVIRQQLKKEKYEIAWTLFHHHPINKDEFDKGLLNSRIKNNQKRLGCSYSMN